MRNITLAVEEDVLSEVRRYAVEHNTTVNALVRAHLEQLARHRSRARQAMRELREMSDASDVAIGDVTWTRDDLHDR